MWVRKTSPGCWRSIEQKAHQLFDSSYNVTLTGTNVRRTTIFIINGLKESILGIPSNSIVYALFISLL